MVVIPFDRLREQHLQAQGAASTDLEALLVTNFVKVSS
jgi:hypothetical protein